MNDEKLQIKIGQGGTVRAVHNDDFNLQKALDGPSPRRGSHVEPGDASKNQDPGKWYADMSPLDPKYSNFVLGPFDTRREALAAEHKFIVDHWVLEQPVTADGEPK